MKNTFNRNSVIEDFQVVGNFVQVDWHNANMLQNERVNIPLGTYHEWLDREGRLMADFGHTDEDGYTPVYCKQTLEDYWKDNLGIETDLKAYLMVLKGEDEAMDLFEQMAAITNPHKNVA